MTADRPSLSYRPEIDGLRALAVSVVVLSHFELGGFRGGFVGVDIFFVLSGFLITRLILDQRAQGRFTFPAFYLRRARRILPALIVMMAATAAAAAMLLLPGDLKRFGESLSAASLGLSNILFWRQDGYFAVDAVSKPLLHTWSLGVEEQFYLVFPLALLAALRLGRRPALMLMAAFAVISLILSQVMLAAHANLSFYLLPTRAWELLLGACLSLATPAPGQGWSAHLAGLTGLLMVAISVWGLSPADPFPGLAAAPAAVGTAALLWAGPNAVTGKALRIPPAVWVGKISYSLYLWHWPLLVFSSYYALDGLSAGARAGLAFAAVVLAAVSWRLVEQPIRRSAGHATLFVILVGGALCTLVVLGAVFSISNGLPGRFTPKVQTLLRPSPQLLACPQGGQEAEDPAYCTLGPANEPPRFVVWGDSHAMALAPAFEAAAMRRGEPGLLVASTGCAPLLEVRWPSRPNCAPFNLRAAERALDPGVQQVFLVGRWALHAEGTRYGDDGGILTLRFPDGAPGDNHAAFASGLAATVERLVGAGKQVVFVDGIPELRTSAPEALAKAMILGRSYDAGVSLAAYRDRQGFTRTTARALAQRYGMTILPTEQVFCPKDECRVELYGASLYRDSHHLSQLGAAQMTDRLVDALTPSAAPPRSAR